MTTVAGMAGRARFRIGELVSVAAGKASSGESLRELAGTGDQRTGEAVASRSGRATLGESWNGSRGMEVQFSERCGKDALAAARQAGQASFWYGSPRLGFAEQAWLE